MNKSDNINPCAVCGKSANYRVFKENTRTYYAIDCKTCHKGSISVINKDHAVEIWNDTNELRSKS